MLAGEPVRVPLPGAGTQVQRQGCHARRAGGGDRRDGGVDRLVAVAEAGQDRGHQHADGEAGVGERPDGVQPAAWVRCARLDAAPEVLVDEPHREGDAHRGHLGGLAQQRQVAQDQRALGEDRERVGEVSQGADDLRHQPVTTLGALVAVHVGAHRHVRAPPARRGQLTPDQLAGVDLDDHLPVEVRAGIEIEIGVRVPGEAVVADHSVGDEVPGAGGDVPERQLQPECLDADNLEGALMFQCATLDRPFTSDGRVGQVKEPEPGGEAPGQPDRPHTIG